MYIEFLLLNTQNNIKKILLLPPYMFLIEGSYAYKGSIYLIKNTVNQ